MITSIARLVAISPQRLCRFERPQANGQIRRASAHVGHGDDPRPRSIATHDRIHVRTPIPHHPACERLERLKIVVVRLRTAPLGSQVAQVALRCSTSWRRSNYWTCRGSNSKTATRTRILCRFPQAKSVQPFCPFSFWIAIRLCWSISFLPPNDGPEGTIGLTNRLTCLMPIATD